MSEQTPVIIPDIGDAEGVEVIELPVEPGARVEVDDVLLVIESDKASLEIPSPAAGTLVRYTVALGDEVETGQVVAEIDAEGGTAATAEPEAQPEAPSQDAPEPVEPAAEAPPAAAAASALVEVHLPDVGDATEITVIEIGVAVGDAVTADQMLVVVESDKASMDIVAPGDGVVESIAVAEGDEVGEAQLLVTLRGSAEAPAAASSELSAPAAAAAPPQTAAPSSAPTPSEASVIAPPPQPAAPPPKKKVIYAGPAVRRMARELGVDLGEVAATGARGRIVKEDVHAYVKKRLQGGGAEGGSGIPEVPAVDFSRFGDVEIEPMSRVRKSGAKNLWRSWLNVVHVTQHDEADVTKLENLRKELKGEGERRGVKITPLAFIMKACAAMLKAHPRFNSSLTPALDGLILKHYVHIGFAVDTPDGLLVPVVRDVDKKGVWDLAEEINELAAKARDKKLAPNNLQGAGFTISSLGAIGGTGFTPIVNAPEVAILGVARLTTKPVWDGEAFQPRKVLPVSLSYDHRAINGAEAGRFATELCQMLGDMRRALL
ncbi:MAG: dihydrolipoyllysine-residue acetyltransferase [Pseudomonadota bacterium]